MTVTAVLEPHQYRKEYEPTEASATVARHDVTGVLQEWGLLDRGLIDTAELVVTELVANAVRHCQCPSVLADATPVVEVTVLHPAPSAIQIVVRDSCPAQPAPRHAAPADEGGRGLFLVQMLASGWGSKAVSGGKVVWAELQL